MNAEGDSDLRVSGKNDVPIHKVYRNMLGMRALRAPDTHHFTNGYENERLKVAVSSMQGWRLSMEDEHSVLLSTPNDPSASFFAVYDGHGGANVAKYLRENLHRDIVNCKEYRDRKYADALRNTFISTDRKLRSIHASSDTIGSTAVTVLLKHGMLYCANLGDSRAVASICGHATPLSYDHKPTNPTERKRISASGSWIYNNRVNGVLAISRCFGDFTLKSRKHVPPEQQAVSPYPDIVSKEIIPEMEFIVLACDGIWDCKTNHEVVDFVRKQIAEKIKPEDIVENLITECLAKDVTSAFGFDNMTVILVCFLHGGTYDKLSEKCAIPTNKQVDPHLTVTSLEIGPPDEKDETMAPRKQRIWGFGPSLKQKPSLSTLFCGLPKTERQTAFRYTKFHPSNLSEQRSTIQFDKYSCTDLQQPKRHQKSVGTNLNNDISNQRIKSASNHNHQSRDYINNVHTFRKYEDELSSFKRWLKSKEYPTK